jgi:glycosyltransferase involved in cell wall biosynthesis
LCPVAAGAGPVAHPARLDAPGTPRRAVHHFYGMTTSWLGMSEEEFAEVNSRPSHSWNECLRALADRRGIDPRVTMYTEGLDAKVLDFGGLPWVFVPVSLGRLHRAPGRLGDFFRRAEYQFSLRFLEELKADSPDLFVFYGNVPTPFGRIVAAYLLRRGIPYAVTIHTRFSNLVEEPPARTFLGRLAGGLIRTLRSPELPFLLRNAGAVILLTEADRRLAIEERLVDPARVHVIPSGVHPAYYRAGEASEKGPFPTLGFVGRLEDAKGFMDALRCFADVRLRHPSARLIVAGTWTSEEYRRAAMEFIAERNLESAIMFRGWIGPEELGPLYRSLHALLFPSRREGLPRAICEAMSCGVPVAAVAGTGGHDEVIVHGVNGVLVGREEWSGEVQALLADRPRLLGMSAAACEAMKGYSLESMIDRAEALYLSLMGPRPAPTRSASSV